MSEPLLRAAVLIVSTTAAQCPAEDLSEGVLRDVIAKDGKAQWIVEEVRIVGDDVLDIQRSIAAWTDKDDHMDLIITTGGTGFATSDCTPEAVTPLLHKHAPGLVHGMLAAALEVTPFALMSRPVAGVRGQTIIVTLPGSPKGARENLQSILRLLPHACLQARGADSRKLHVGGVKQLEKDAGIGPGRLGRSSDSQNAHVHTHEHPLHSHSHGHGMPVRYTSTDNHPQSNDPSLGPTRRSRKSPYPMLSVEEALKLIKEHTPAPQAVKASVSPSLVGSVLAEDVIATVPVPAYRASIVDGYAISVHFDSVVKGTYTVASVSHAKAAEQKEIQPGQVIRVTTGAPVPAGGSISVVMLEDTVLETITDDGEEEKEISILAEMLQPGTNIREVGSDITVGSTILRRGEEVSANGGELGLLASLGQEKVMVYKKPTVGVMSTGDEVVDHDRPGPLRAGEVRDCNRPTILAALRGWGYEAIDLKIAKDTPGDLENALRDAFRKVDVVITTGGVSMGELDLLKPIIERALGGTIHFGRVSMKPGKPTTFGSVSLKDNNGERVKKSIFALPGNPASGIVTLHLFVLPSLHYASGVSPAGLPKVLVEVAHDFPLDPVRPEYHRATVSLGKDGLLYANSTGGQRSSRVGSLKSANALVCLPAGKEPMSKGTKIEALLMSQIKSEWDKP